MYLSGEVPQEIADARGEKLHQLALQWVLRDEVVTSALIGASRPEQITDNAEILSMPPASGWNTMQPTFSFRSTSVSPFSICRSSMEYRG